MLEAPPRRQIAQAARISTAGSRVAVYAISTDEEQMIAQLTLAVLRRGFNLRICLDPGMADDAERKDVRNR